MSNPDPLDPLAAGHAPAGPPLAGNDPPLMTCTCGHDQTFHWAHRGACEACACLYFKLRPKAVTR